MERIPRKSESIYGCLTVSLQILKYQRKALTFQAKANWVDFLDISRLPCYSGAGSGFLGALIISNYPLNLKLKCIGPSILRGLLIHSHCTWCLIVYGSAVSTSHRPCLGTITLVHPNLNIRTPLLLLHSLRIRSHKYVEGFLFLSGARWLSGSIFDC